MGRPPSDSPKYCCQKRPSGRHDAYVDIQGRRHYLGLYGTPESKEAYHRLLAELAINGGQAPVPPEQITLVELCDRYLTFAKTYYVKHGEPTAEPDNLLLAMRPLKELYGRTKAVEFGPRALKAVRDRMVAQGGSRMYINRHVGRLKRMFKWAVAEELLPGSAYHALQAVAGLKLGRSSAKEHAPVKPAPIDLVEAVKKVVSRQVAAMIDLQLLTGARPGEIVIMRGIDLDTSGPVWVYKPSAHKTEHHGHERWIPLGPKARAIVEPFLANRPLHAYLFSPQEAEAERYATKHAQRKTPASCGNSPTPEGQQFAHRTLGNHYDRNSYARAIARACEVAFPAAPELRRRWVSLPNKRRWESVREWKARLGPERWAQFQAWRKEHHWHPHQLRHNFATEIRRIHGLEIAQILLGHAKADVTQVYAERDLNRAIAVAAKIG